MILSKFKSLRDLEKAFSDEQSCINYLEKVIWNNNPVSPFDPTSKVYKCANNRYKCKNTGKYFNIKSGTIFKNSKLSLREWFRTLYLFSVSKKGISTYQLTDYVDITQKSTWFVLQRLRRDADCFTFKTTLEGVVEIDETFIGGKNKNRHWNKKVPNSQGRGSCKDKIPVWGAIERGGNLIAQVVPNTKLSMLEQIINANVENGSTVYTDEWYRHSNLSQNFKHQWVNHSAKPKQYANGKISTNTIESAWVTPKRSVYGIYHNISRKHAQRYVDEFTFRYNTRKYSVQDRFDLMLSSTVGKQMTYQQLIS